MNVPRSAEAAVKPMATKRQDSWWLEPLLVAVGFGLFIIYATYRAFMGSYYEVDNYLSPFYSPKLMFDWWSYSPAILILWMPAGFRATCYYYRKAYYRAYFMDPPACAVGHFGGDKYCGEAKGLLVLQNIHRYMLYLAIVVIGFLWVDACNSLFVGNPFDGGEFRLGLGSIIFFVNVVLLSFYTFGCHAFRHLVGGRLDCFSCSSGAKTQHGLWSIVSKLNEHHMLWAWCSLFSVMATDFYVWMVTSKQITDLTLIGPNLPFQHVI